MRPVTAFYSPEYYYYKLRFIRFYDQSVFSLKKSVFVVFITKDYTRRAPGRDEYNAAVSFKTARSIIISAPDDARWPLITGINDRSISKRPVSAGALNNM